MPDAVQRKFLLSKPISYFSKDLSVYGSVSTFIVSDTSETFWECESLIFYVHSGRGFLYVNGEAYHLQAGSFAFLHTFHVFSFTVEGDKPLEMSVLTCPCVEMVYDVVDHLDASYSLWPSCVLPCPENQERIEEILALYRKETENTPVNGLLLHAQMSQLNNIFYDEMSLWRKSHEEPSHPLNARLMLYIWEWRTSPLRVQDVAESFHISVKTLNLELRGAYGCDFRQLLNRARVAYAYPALFQDGISVQSLAKQAGFPNEKAFSRAFRDVFRCSPQKYRDAILCSQNSRIVHLIRDKVLDVMGYMLHNYQMPITIKSCEKELFLTESDINQVFRIVFPEENGYTFHSFLTELRLRHAAGMLTMTDVSVYDIAMHSGFNSIHTFIRQFKKKYGMTPSAYRGYR